MIIINYYSLKADRGRGQRELLRILSDMFGTAQVMMEHMKSVILGVTQVSPAVVDDDGEIQQVELGDIVQEFLASGSTKGSTLSNFIEILAEHIFLYDPLNRDVHTSWSSREQLIDRLCHQTVAITG